MLWLPFIIKMPPPRDVKKQQSLNDDEKRVLACRYRVERKLGSGNFGIAFLGKNYNFFYMILKQIRLQN